MWGNGETICKIQKDTDYFAGNIFCDFIVSGDSVGSRWLPSSWLRSSLLPPSLLPPLLSWLVPLVGRRLAVPPSPSPLSLLIQTIRAVYKIIKDFDLPLTFFLPEIFYSRDFFIPEIFIPGNPVSFFPPDPCNLFSIV